MRERKPRLEATNAVASDSSARTRRETAWPRKEQINEVDRALNGVGDVHLRHEYARELHGDRPSP